MPRPNRGPYLDVNRAGVYEIRFSVRGRSRSRSTGTRDFQLAQKILANFILLGGAADAAMTAADTPMLVRDALGDPEPDSPHSPSYWHEHVLRNVVGIETQRYSVRKLIEHFGHMPVQAIRPTDITAYIDKRRSGALGKPSKDGTIARELSVLNAAMHHQCRAKRIKHDDIPTIKLPKPAEPKDRWLTQEEAAKLMDAAMKGARSAKHRLPRVYKFVVLALATASRKTALLELRKEQVDLERGMIRLNPSGRKQTKKRRPLVPISDDLMPIIKRIVAEAPGEFLLEHPGSIRSAFENCAERAGLKDVTPHTLRHTAASWMVQNGVPLEQVAAVLGDTIATVERVYAHHCPEHLRSAVNTIRFAARAA